RRTFQPRSCSSVTGCTGGGSRRSRSGVESIVGGYDMRIATVNVHLFSLVALITRGHIHCAAIDNKHRFRVHCVIARIDGERAAIKSDESACGVLVIVRLDAVAARRYGERAVAYLHAIAPTERVLYRSNSVGAT